MRGESQFAILSQVEVFSALRAKDRYLELSVKDLNPDDFSVFDVRYQIVPGCHERESCILLR